MSRNRTSQNQFRYNIKGIFCIYCGDPATCRDHFPPYSLCLSGFLLPACRECNALAGTDYPFDIKSRVRLVHEKLERRYRRLADSPEWSSNELRALGYTLRSSVQSWDKMRRQLIQRLNWDAMAYLAMQPSAREFLAVALEVPRPMEAENMAFKRNFEEYVATQA